MIKKEQYTEYTDALNYLNASKLPFKLDAFKPWANQLKTYAFDSNLNDEKFNIILEKTNEAYSNLDYPADAIDYIAQIYLTQTNYFTYKKEYNKALEAFE